MRGDAQQLLASLSIPGSQVFSGFLSFFSGRCNGPRSELFANWRGFAEDLRFSQVALVGTGVSSWLAFPAPMAAAMLSNAIIREAFASASFAL